MTAAKYIPALRTSFYASLNYSEWDEKINFPFGGTLEFGKGISTRVMYDGDRSHLLLNYFPDRFGISLMYVWLEKAGVSISFGF